MKMIILSNHYTGTEEILKRHGLGGRLRPNIVLSRFATSAIGAVAPGLYAQHPIPLAQVFLV